MGEVTAVYRDGVWELTIFDENESAVARQRFQRLEDFPGTDQFENVVAVWWNELGYAAMPGWDEDPNIGGYRRKIGRLRIGK